MANSFLTNCSKREPDSFETATVAIQPEEWIRIHWTKVSTNILVVVVRNRNQRRRPTYLSLGKREDV
jgi:hypothetical protein